MYDKLRVFRWCKNSVNVIITRMNIGVPCSEVSRETTISKTSAQSLLHANKHISEIVYIQPLHRLEC